jgi:hypothetical protein
MPLSLISGTAGAAVLAKLPGNGHLPSIGARFPAPQCPVLPGETVAETVAIAAGSGLSVPSGVA